MPSARKSKPSCVRPGRGIDFRNKAAAFLRGGSPGEEHDTRTPLRQGRRPPRNLCDMLLSGWCRIQAATPWRNRGMPDIPRSAVGKLANFCDVSSSHELRTNPPVIDGSAKSWNAGGVATSPEGRCAGSCSLEGLEGVSAPPQGPQLPCLLPTWQGAPT